MYHSQCLTPPVDCSNDKQKSIWDTGKQMSRGKTAVKDGLIGMCALAVLASLALPNAARAADYNSQDSWDGFYIGIHAGYGFFDADNSGAGQSWNEQADGPTGGVLVGYNMDLGDYVLGLEADTSFGDLSNDTLIGPIGNVHVANHGQHTFRVRAGMDMGTGLLYATGGLAMSDIWLRAAGVRDKNFLWGGVVGAGYEAKITADITLRAEYLYAVYAEQTYQLTEPVSLEYQTHSVRAGVAWQF